MGGKAPSHTTSRVQRTPPPMTLKQTALRILRIQPPMLPCACVLPPEMRHIYAEPLGEWTAAPRRAIRAITDTARADRGYIRQATANGCPTVPPSACGWDLIQLADEGRGEGHFKSTVQGQKNQYSLNRAAFAPFVSTRCSPFFWTLGTHIHAHQHSHARRTT